MGGRERIFAPDASLAEALGFSKPTREIVESDRQSYPLIRVNDLARELGVKSGAVLAALPIVGVTRSVTYSAVLGKNEADKVRIYLGTKRSEEHTSELQ